MINICNRAKLLVGLTLAFGGMLSLGVPLGHTSSQPAPPTHLAGNPTLTTSTTNSLMIPCPPEIFGMTKNQFDPSVPNTLVNIPQPVRDNCLLPASFSAGTTMVGCPACEAGGFKVTIFNVWVQQDAARGSSTQLLKFSCPPGNDSTPQPYRYTDCGTGPLKVGPKIVSGTGTVKREGNNCWLSHINQGVPDPQDFRYITAMASQYNYQGTAKIKLRSTGPLFSFSDSNLKNSSGVCPISFPSFP